MGCLRTCRTMSYTYFSTTNQIFEIPGFHFIIEGFKVWRTQGKVWDERDTNSAVPAF